MGVETALTGRVFGVMGTGGVMGVDAGLGSRVAVKGLPIRVEGLGRLNSDA